MCEIKLLALDLDGTLTNSKKQVSDKNREYIKKAQMKGINIVLASGRPVIGIRNVANVLDLWNTGGYILAYNGGQIIDCKTGVDMVKQIIPMGYYHDICAVSQKFDVYPLSYNEKGVICENGDNVYVKKEAYNNSVPVFKVANLEKEVKEPVVKFMVVGEPEELQKAYVHLSQLFFNKLNVFFSEPYFMEITALGIEKASSLKCLCEKLRLMRENVMACGDGLNDIPMLNYAGLSIYMANGYEETKSCANFIVPSNDDDGVAYAIEQFVLKEELQ